MSCTLPAHRLANHYYDPASSGRADNEEPYMLVVDTFAKDDVPAIGETVERAAAAAEFALEFLDSLFEASRRAARLPNEQRGAGDNHFSSRMAFESAHTNEALQTRVYNALLNSLYSKKFVEPVGLT